MRKQASFMLLLLLVGCKGPGVTGADYAGPWLGYTPSQEAARVAFGETEFVGQSECVGYAVTRIRVEFLPLPVTVYPGSFRCGLIGTDGQPTGGVMANGCAWQDHLGVDTRYFERVLSHELVHWFFMRNGGPPDYQHQGWVWAACDRLNPPGSYTHTPDGGFLVLHDEKDGGLR